MSTATLFTADQLLPLPDNSHRYELIAGELRRMSPAGWKHGLVAGRMHGWLAHYVEEHNLGVVFEGETGFLLKAIPRPPRARRGVCPPQPLARRRAGRGVLAESPDLAVEVVSPGDTVHEVDDKVRAWLDAGAAMVWVINPNPKWRSVTVYRPPANAKVLTEDDELSGEDVLPGFRLAVRDCSRCKSTRYARLRRRRPTVMARAPSSDQMMMVAGSGTVVSVSATP